MLEMFFASSPEDEKVLFKKKFFLYLLWGHLLKPKNFVTRYRYSWCQAALPDSNTWLEALARSLALRAWGTNW